MMDAKNSNDIDGNGVSTMATQVARM